MAATDAAKLSVSGQAFAALLDCCGNAAGDCDGLLFGRAVRPPPPPPSFFDDDDDAPTSSAPTLSISITGHASLAQPASLSDALGRFHPYSPGRPDAVGFFSSRRSATLRPSMREAAVARSLSKSPAPRPTPRARPLSPLRLLQPLHPLLRLPRLPARRFPPRPRLPPGRQRGSWLLGPVPHLRGGVANAVDASAAGKGLRPRGEEGDGSDDAGVRAEQITGDADFGQWVHDRGGGVVLWDAKKAGWACSGDGEQRSSSAPSGIQELIAKETNCRAELRAEISSSASCVHSSRKVARFEARIIELC